MIFHILLLFASGLLLFRAASILVKGVNKIARYLKWRRFIISFFIMAIVGSVPNLFVGISSVIHGVPELALGDMIGNNTVDLTLVVALSVIFGGSLVARGAIIQLSTLLTIGISILPLLLIVDGTLGKGDGIVLIFVFIAYSFWLLSKRKSFPEKLGDGKDAPLIEFKEFMKSLVFVGLGIIFLLVAAEGIVRSISFFAGEFNLPIAVLGILVVGLGNSLPELYFSVAAAREKENWIVLGELMGSIIVPATLVIGIVAFLSPIHVPDSSPFSIGRFFLILSAFFFLLFARTDRKITRAEALFLLDVYLLFVISILVSQNGGLDLFNRIFG